MDLHRSLLRFSLGCRSRAGSATRKLNMICLLKYTRPRQGKLAFPDPTACMQTGMGH